MERTATSGSAHIARLISPVTILEGLLSTSVCCVIFSSGSTRVLDMHRLPSIYLGHVTRKGTPAIQTTARSTQVSREQVIRFLEAAKDRLVEADA